MQLDPNELGLRTEEMEKVGSRELVLLLLLPLLPKPTGPASQAAKQPRKSASSVELRWLNFKLRRYAGIPVRLGKVDLIAGSKDPSDLVIDQTNYPRLPPPPPPTTSSFV